MTKLDPTFHPECLYGSVKWVQQRLGLSEHQWTTRKEALEAAGLPKPDPLFKTRDRYIKADVDAWVNQRRNVADETVVEPTRTEANFDEL